MIRLVLADDHPVFRAGLRELLSSHYPDIEVAGEAATGEETLAAAESLRPTVLLLDVAMPGPGFLNLLRLLRARCPEVAVLVLSAHPEEQYAIHVLRAGAAGFVSKIAPLPDLVAAIRQAATGRRYVSHEAAGLLAEAVSGAPAGLSARELEVLRRIGAGRSVKEIAAELGISPKTVSTFRTRLLAKLGLHSTAELVRYAVDRGLA
jgi:two-component system, NarL family, invasion response regulator UvrY